MLFFVPWAKHYAATRKKSIWVVWVFERIKSALLCICATSCHWRCLLYYQPWNFPYNSTNMKWVSTLSIKNFTFVIVFDCLRQVVAIFFPPMDTKKTTLYFTHQVTNWQDVTRVVTMATQYKPIASNEKGKENTYTIGGVTVEFPCKAYSTQVSMMSMVSSGLYASFLKGQGHQGIFSVAKGTLWGNCKFQGHQGNGKGSPPLPPWISIRPVSSRCMKCFPNPQMITKSQNLERVCVV